MAGHRHCLDCSNKSKAATRLRHSELPPEERKKANARSYTNVLIRRGVLMRQPCRDCGAEKVQPHHPDYNDPRNVVWLCSRCHRELHRKEYWAKRMQARAEAT